MSSAPPVLKDEASTASTMQSIVGVMTSVQEKWNTSGANDALLRATAAIPESTKTYVGTIFQREHIRSLSIFFGIGEERPFYIERTISLLIDRLKHNVRFFYFNYMIVTGILFCLTLIISPTALIGIGLLAAAWMWMIRSSQTGELKISGVSIPQKTAAGIMSVISIFVLLWLLSGIFWWTLFSSGFLVCVHAFLRDASMHKDMEDAVTMEGDLQIITSSSSLPSGGDEDATFLNQA